MFSLSTKKVKWNEISLLQLKLEKFVPEEVKLYVNVPFSIQIFKSTSTNPEKKRKQRKRQKEEENEKFQSHNLTTIYSQFNRHNNIPRTPAPPLRAPSTSAPSNFQQAPRLKNTRPILSLVSRSSRQKGFATRSIAAWVTPTLIPRATVAIAGTREKKRKRGERERERERERKDDLDFIVRHVNIYASERNSGRARFAWTDE